MKQYKYIGENIQSFLKDMSPAELSRISGVPAMTIGRTIRNETIPEIDTLIHIAKGLNVPVSAIVCENQIIRDLIIELYNMPPDKLHAAKTFLKS